MPRKHQNSIIRSDLNPVIIESGRIINVNMRRWTADVRTVTSQSTFWDIQWGNPYLHFHSGEGIYAMPEVGAKCLVTRPSDSPPIITSFITTFERVSTPEQSEEDAQVEPDQSEDSQSSSVNFSAGRPQMQQGDLMMRTRDGNHVWLRRGGVIEIGASHVAKRFYIPLLNFIRDVAENYELLTPGGEMTWRTERTAQTASSDTTHDQDTGVVLTIAHRNFAQDEKASVAVRMGHVDDSKRYRMLIAPNAINPRSLEVTGDAVYSLEIDEAGEITFSNAADVTAEVGGSLNVNVTGDVGLTVGGSSTESISGSKTVEVSGEHSLEAASSRERISGSKTVDCADINLGGAGGKNVVVMNAMLATYLTSHVHPTPGASPSGVPMVPQLVTALTTKAK